VFLDGEDPIGVNIVQDLMNTARPADFDFFDPLAPSQTKMNPIITWDV